MATSTYGQLGQALAEALAWLNSPAAIDGEIRCLETAQAEGDTTAATAAQLADWRAVRDTQRRLLAKEGAGDGE